MHIEKDRTMKDTIIPHSGSLPREVAGLSRFIDRYARSMLFSLLACITEGCISLKENRNRFVFGRFVQKKRLNATVTIHHPLFYRHVVFGGNIGAGRAYIDGHFSCDDLTALVRIMIRNRRAMNDMDSGTARLFVPLLRIGHLLRRNTRIGSCRNIHAHYDLGNEFYALFLDPTMTYSCGIFESDQSTMEAASLAKFDRICRKLELTPTDHVLEVGCGWGGFAIHCATRYGCRVTGVTISKAQYELAAERVRQAGMSDRIELRLSDYRDLTGRFDKLVSIEMIEAVGHQYLGTFFKHCDRLLRDDGRMMLQAIVINDQAYERHKRSVDFIKHYIFPGGCLTAVTPIMKAVTAKTDMRLVHMEDITAHYVKTLQSWREQFFKHIRDVKAMGFKENFIRMWHYYLCYCEAGFAERYIGDVQMVFRK